MPQRLHCSDILDHLMSLIETDLRVSLSLQGIYRGELSWLPPEAITDMVNGIWIHLNQTTDIEEVSMPSGLQFVYRFRILFVRKVDVSNNVNDTKIGDGETLLEFLYDNHQLSALTLSNGQALWMHPRSIEWEPDEDVFVNTLSEDLTAIAVNVECAVRTKI